MIDAVNELLKQLRKSYQKSSVRAIGAVGMQKNMDNKNKVSKKGEAVLSEVTSSLTKTTQSLESSIKGQFGKAVHEAFNQQKSKLEKFKD